MCYDPLLRGLRATIPALNQWKNKALFLSIHFWFKVLLFLLFWHHLHTNESLHYLLCGGFKYPGLRGEKPTVQGPWKSLTVPTLVFIQLISYLLAGICRHLVYVCVCRRENTQLINPLTACTMPALHSPSYSLFRKKTCLAPGAKHVLENSATERHKDENSTKMHLGHIHYMLTWHRYITKINMSIFSQLGLCCVFVSSDLFLQRLLHYELLGVSDAL